MSLDSRQNSFSSKQLLIFDFDGTLIDSVPDLAIAINRMLVKLGRTAFPEDTVRHWVGNGARDLVARALSGDVRIDPELNEGDLAAALEIFFGEYEASICEATTLYPQVLETLQQLQRNGYTLALVTNKPERFVAPILDALNLTGLFALILGGDSLPQKKPDPLPLLHCCEQLDIAVQHSVMVGDSKNDILAAQAAAMESVAVSYGYNYGAPIADFNPDVVIDDFALMLDLFVAAGS